MTINLDLTNGTVNYNLQNVVRATEGGQVIEYAQFNERFIQDTGEPLIADDGVAGSFYVDVENDANTLYFRRTNGDDPDTWIEVSSTSSGGGGSALSIFNQDATSTAIATATTSLTFIGDGVVAAVPGDANQVTVTITNPTIASSTSGDNVVLTMMPGGNTTTIDAATPSTPGVMSGTDKTKLDRLNDLTVTGTTLTNTNPTELDFSVSGNALSIDTETGNLLTWTPTDPSTGDFAEETVPFENLDTAGATRSELTFAGGVDTLSVVQKNGVTIQLGDDYDIVDSTTVRILGRSFNDQEVTVLNGGILENIAGPFTFSDNVTINGNLTANGDTTLGNEATDEITVNGVLTTNGTADLDGDVVGEGFVEAVVDLVNEHGGSSSLHLHGTASTTDPVDFVTAPGGNHLLSYLFQAVSGDFNDAINYFTYDDTMVWRFIGEDGPTRNQFSRGNYYATSGYFPTTGGTLTTEQSSDEVQSGEWLLLCTGVTQEPSGRLTVSFRVISNGIDVTTDSDWFNHPDGSSEYVIDSDNFDRTSASKYNLINVSVSNSGIVTQLDNGDFISATAENIYDAVAAGNDEDRRHILNELEGISGIPNSAVTATRDSVTWYSEGRGYRGATAVEADPFSTFGVVSGSFFMIISAPDGDLSFMTDQMIVFTIGAADGLPTGINPNRTYTATVSGIGVTDPALPFVTLANVIENGTSNIITPDVGGHVSATGVTLRAYHAQLNEEFIIDPLDLIDSVEEMTATQKEEFRDAARINFESRSGLTRVTTAANSNIPDIASFPASTETVIVMIQVSGYSGVTEFVIDFDGFLHRTVTDTDVDADGNNYIDTINSGDDVTIAVTVPLGTSPSSYVATTLVQVEFIGAPAELELIEANLGDLIGAGATIEDADLVVTPERIESAIHILSEDSAALADVQASLGIDSSNDGNQIVIDDDTYTFTTGTTTEGEHTLILTRNSNSRVYGTWIERSGNTVDFMVTGQFIAGGG